MNRSPRFQLALSLLFLASALALYSWVQRQPAFNTQPFDRGLELIAAQQFDEAVPFLEKSLQSNPDNPLILVNLGLCYHMQSKEHQAVDKYTRATLYASGDLLAVILSNRGWSEVLLGLNRRAIQDATWALEYTKNPIYQACAYAVRSTAWAQQGCTTAALSDLNRAIALLPDSAELRIHRAHLYRRMGMVKAAEYDEAHLNQLRWAPTYFFHDQKRCPICKNNIQ